MKKARLMRSFSALCIRHPLQVTIQAGINAFHYTFLCFRERDRQVPGYRGESGQRGSAEDAAKAVRTARAEVARGWRDWNVFGDGLHRVLGGPAPDAVDLAGAAWRPMPAASGV